jgi:DNA-binding NarL/FixJ family response regulator
VQRLPFPTDVHICNNVRPLLDDEKKLDTASLILMDLQMPTIDGLSFLTALKIKKISTPSIVVSSTENTSEIERALELGAKGFIPKNAPAKVMIEGITKVLNGDRFVPEYLIGNIAWPKEQTDVHANDHKMQNEAEAITERQTQVLNLMQIGNSNSEIAQILGVSESAIKGHISRLFKLLNAKNRTGCVRAAIEKKLI